VVAGFRKASVASGLPLNAASTSCHAVVEGVRHLNNRAITPASTLPR
jgi:hypothetical protein